MTGKEPITYDSYKSLLLLVNSKSIVDSKLAILSLQYYIPNITLLRYGSYLISYYYNNHVVRCTNSHILLGHEEISKVISYIQEIAIIRLKKQNRKKKHEFKRSYLTLLIRFTSIYSPHIGMGLEKRVDELLSTYINTNE